MMGCHIEIHFAYWFVYEIQSGYGLLLVYFTFSTTSLFKGGKPSKSIGEH